MGTRSLVSKAPAASESLSHGARPSFSGMQPRPPAATAAHTALAWALAHGPEEVTRPQGSPWFATGTLAYWHLAAAKAFQGRTRGTAGLAEAWPKQPAARARWPCLAIHSLGHRGKEGVDGTGAGGRAASCLKGPGQGWVPCEGKCWKEELCQGAPAGAPSLTQSVSSESACPLRASDPGGRCGGVIRGSGRAGLGGLYSPWCGRFGGAGQGEEN